MEDDDLDVYNVKIHKNVYLDSEIDHFLLAFQYPAETK